VLYQAEPLPDAGVTDVNPYAGLTSCGQEEVGGNLAVDADRPRFPPSVTQLNAPVMRTSAGDALSMRHAADLLGLSRATVCQLSKAGVLPTVKVAGITMLDVDRLAALLRALAATNKA
jgi:hypothetical protein